MLMVCFRRHVLQLSSGIDEMGNLRWQLVITLALSWVCVFLCLFKGVKVLGKVRLLRCVPSHKLISFQPYGALS